MGNENYIYDLIRKAAAAGEVESVITPSEEALLDELADATKGLTFFEIIRRLKGEA